MAIHWKKTLFFLNCLMLFVVTKVVACGSPVLPFQVVTLLPNDHLVCVWEEMLNEKGVIRSRTSADGIHWSETVTISEIDVFNAAPTLHTDPSGNVYAFWATGVPNSMGINTCLATATLPFDGVWSNPVILSDKEETIGAWHELRISSEKIVAFWDTWKVLGDKTTLRVFRTATLNLSLGKWSSPLSINDSHE